MATYRTVSSQTIIARLYRNLKLGGTEYIESFYEWIGEALEHIGCGANLVKKPCVIEIKDYKGMLPADLYMIEIVGGTSQKTNIFIANPNWEQYDMQSAFAALFPYSKPLAYGSRIFNKEIHGQGCINEYVTSSDTYITDGNHIKTSFQEGTVTLIYTGFETDEDGFAMVPDDISFKEALFWYCFKLMLLSGYKHPEFNFEKADARWQLYCTQARNGHNMLDLSQASSFTNQWTRMIPQLNLHGEWYNTLQDQERLMR